MANQWISKIRRQDFLFSLLWKVFWIFFFFFFFYIKSSFLFLLEHMARRVKKYTHTTEETRLLDDSFGADILSICTASIFIHIDVFPFCSDYKNNLYFFNKTSKRNTKSLSSKNVFSII